MTTEPSANSSTPLLEVRDLVVHFPVRRGVLGQVTGTCRAVDGVSFDVPTGTTLGLVGESGCGKTTVGRTILRLVGATRGRVMLEGVDVFAASGPRLRQLRRNMQIVFQDPVASLNPRLTVGEIIAEPFIIHRIASGRRCREHVARLLDLVGLEPSYAEHYPHEFSGGQRQRIGIARAIALEPKFVVCDEPVSALDVSVQSQILSLLGNLQSRLGLSYLFIAHNLPVVRQFSDRVMVMYLGRIVEIGDAADIYSGPTHPYTRALLEAAPVADPRRRRKRAPLRGEVPSPLAPPTGCAFNPRCSYVTDECRRATPPLQPQPDLAPGHLVACHRQPLPTVDGGSR